MNSTLVARAGALALTLGFATPVAAHDTAADLFHFDQASGYAPNGGVIDDAHGTLFGTAPIGGNGPCDGGAGCGTIYALSQSGGNSWSLTTLYNFQDAGDGWAPNAQLTLGPDSSLFGYPSAGSNGIVFQLRPPAKGRTSWTYDVLYNFTGGADGNLLDVTAPLVRQGNALYGIASGGSNACGQFGCGSVYRLTPPKSGTGSWTETTLFNFTSGSTGGEPSSIVGPGPNKTLYVATDYGKGAVVQIAPPTGKGAWTETVLATFGKGSEGDTPSNLVLGAGDTIYGLANTGETGLAFQLAKGQSGWARTTISRIAVHRYSPSSLAPGANGALIGAIWGDIDTFPGAIFQLTPPRGNGEWTFKELWNFNRGPVRGADRNPVNVVAGKGGHPFGVLNGGDYGNGGLFELK